MNIAGVLIGGGAFLIIGLCHPLVIKTEYYFGVKVWPVFLVLGLACIAGALFIPNDLVSALVGILGFSFLWSIHELFEQKNRVEKGWFPANPAKQSGGEDKGQGE